LPFASVPRGAVTLAPLSAEQQENAARDLMLVIVDELRPVSLFEDDTVGVKAVADPRMSLKRFLLKYRPDLNVVSRRTLVTLRKREYGQLKNASIVRLKQLPCLYGTTDAWTSDANVAYRTFAVVGIDPELWEPVHLCLATRAVPRHTDIAVIQFYRDILSEFSIAAGKLLGIVADGNERSSVTVPGFAIVTALRMCSIWCSNMLRVRPSLPRLSLKRRSALRSFESRRCNISWSWSLRSWARR
jgi:hypothetical protein